MTFGWTTIRKIRPCDDSVKWLSAIFFSAKQRFGKTAFRQNDDLMKWRFGKIMWPPRADITQVEVVASLRVTYTIFDRDVMRKYFFFIRGFICTAISIYMSPSPFLLPSRFPLSFTVFPLKPPPPLRMWPQSFSPMLYRICTRAKENCGTPVPIHSTISQSLSPVYAVSEKITSHSVF